MKRRKALSTIGKAALGAAAIVVGGVAYYAGILQARPGDTPANMHCTISEVALSESALTIRVKNDGNAPWRLSDVLINAVSLNPTESGDIFPGRSASFVVDVQGPVEVVRDLTYTISVMVASYDASGNVVGTYATTRIVIATPGVDISAPPPAVLIAPDYRQIALDYVSTRYNIPQNELGIYGTYRYFPTLEIKLYDAKVFHTKASYSTYLVSVDMSGNIVDEQSIEQMEKDAYSKKFGKLEPELFYHLQNTSDNDVTEVTIYLKTSGLWCTTNTTHPHPGCEPDPRVIAEIERPLLEWLQTNGIKPIEIYRISPTITVKLTKRLIMEASSFEYVLGIGTYKKYVTTTGG